LADHERRLVMEELSPFQQLVLDRLDAAVAVGVTGLAIVIALLAVSAVMSMRS